jgi:DNA-directed RNA polymerase subunit alpha
MTEFMRPQVTVDTIDDRVARYTVEPLERGFGYTLGNCMRRVLLSSLRARPRRRSVSRAYSTSSPRSTACARMSPTSCSTSRARVPRDGMGAGDAVATLSQRAGTVTGADLKVPAEFELVNPEHVIATLNKGAKLEMSIRVGVGRGLRIGRPQQASGGSDRRHHRRLALQPGRALHLRGGEHACGSAHRLRQAHLEVETNGSIDPGDAVARAGRIIERAHDALRGAGRKPAVGGGRSSPLRSTRATACWTRRSRSSTSRSARTTA